MCLHARECSLPCSILFLIFPPQSSIYSLALKSVISLSTIILVGLIIAYHCCEVQVRLREMSSYSRDQNVCFDNQVVKTAVTPRLSPSTCLNARFATQLPESILTLCRFVCYSHVLLSVLSVLVGHYHVLGLCHQSSLVTLPCPQTMAAILVTAGIRAGISQRP